MSEAGAYGGSENLEVMREAVNYNRYLLRTLRRYAPQRGRVLDFGAGNGEFARPVKALGYDVSAVEPDRALQQRLADAGIGAVAAASAFADDSFAYIYTLNVLEHIENDVEAVRELRAKLAPGGTLLVYVPAFPVLYTSMDRKVGHIRRYTRSTLVNAISQAGLTTESVRYVDSLGFFATLFFKHFGGSSGEINRGMLRLYDRIVFPLSRALDRLTGAWFGKNLLLIARKAA
jgi:SAM-dependent methyltransferase